uniref:Mesoderm induction early response 1, family member 2 n=1 Tax=Cynoglossus semilaevis TaxID=244447 RepID=A0A3P8UF18_CYNSE
MAEAGDLPLEELLALYGYTMSDPNKDNCKKATSLPGMTLDKDQITVDLYPGEDESADGLPPSVTSNTSDLLRQLQDGDKDTLVSTSDDDSDGTSVPSNEEHKEIMVGSMYQAKIPPLSPFPYQEKGCSTEDQLLWKPGVLPVQEVEEFLLSTKRPRVEKGAAHTLMSGVTVRDNEQALYELIKCNFNTEEALRRFHFNVRVFSEELCSWSEDECRNFEHGYRVYGKNFHLIQANKVRTRSVGECVEYYYMWKKSERHEYFTQQTTRLSRKKYSLQSGSMEDGDQDVEVGELEGSKDSTDVLSHSSVGKPEQLESKLPQDLDKPDGELVMGLSELYEDLRPQQLFSGPFSLQSKEDLQDPGLETCCPSAPDQLLFPHSALHPQLVCRGPQCCHDDHSLPGSCFYQLHMRGGPFVPEDMDCTPPAGAGGGAHGLQVELSVPSFSPPSSTVFPSHLQTIGNRLQPSTSQ